MVLRETLLGQLSAHIKSIQDDFVARTGSSMHSSASAAGDSRSPLTGKNLPEVVNNIVWARQLEAKVPVFVVLSVQIICASVCLHTH